MLFQRRHLAADEAEHHALVLHEAQRREVAGALGVVFEQEVIDARLAEEALGDRLVAAGRQIVALEIAAAHVHAEHHVGRRARDRVVDGLDVEIDQPVGLSARGFDLLADRGIAQQRDRDLVELDVAAAGLDQPGDLLAEDRASDRRRRLRRRRRPASSAKSVQR